MTPPGKQKLAPLRLGLGLLILAALFTAGCGGEFWGSVGDWEPGELSAVPIAPRPHQKG